MHPVADRNRLRSLLLEDGKLGSHAALAARGGILVQRSGRGDLVERASGLAHFLLGRRGIASDDGLQEVTGVALHTTLAPEVTRVAGDGLTDTLLG